MGNFSSYNSTLKIAEINGDGDSFNRWKEEILVFLWLLWIIDNYSGDRKKGKKLATLASAKPVHLHEANITESVPPPASTDTGTTK